MTRFVSINNTDLIIIIIIIIIIIMIYSALLCTESASQPICAKPPLRPTPNIHSHSHKVIGEVEVSCPRKKLQIRMEQDLNHQHFGYWTTHSMSYSVAFICCRQCLASHKPHHRSLVKIDNALVVICKLFLGFQIER